MDAPGVDWALVDERVPTAQIPSARAERDELFARMDARGSGFITVSEAQLGLPRLLEQGGGRKKGEAKQYLVPIKDFKPSVKLAFSVSKKVAPTVGSSKKERSDHDTCIDRREFHALLVAFRTYIELNVLFQAIDQDSSRGRLNWKECSKALPLLEKWNIDEKQARGKFPDDWTPTMSFGEFAQWCITRRFGQLELELDQVDPEETLKDAAGNGEVVQMVKAFQDWDVDNSGTISAEELAAVLMALDPEFTKDDAMKLFEAADMNKDGKIDYREFTLFIAQ